QAEDGIRERNVTGVQTCALPISKDLVNAVPVPLFFGFEEMERTWVGDTLSSRFLGAGSSWRADGGYGGDGETSCRKHWARASHGECAESVVGSFSERVGQLDVRWCGYFRCGTGVVEGSACGCGRLCTR